MIDIKSLCKIVNALNQMLTPYSYALDIDASYVSGSDLSCDEAKHKIVLVLRKYEDALKQRQYLYDDAVVSALNEYVRSNMTECDIYNRIGWKYMNNPGLFNLHLKGINNSRDYSLPQTNWHTVKEMFVGDDKTKSILDYVDHRCFPDINPFSAICLDEFSIKMDLLGMNSDFLNDCLA